MNEKSFKYKKPVWAPRLCCNLFKCHEKQNNHWYKWSSTWRGTLWWCSPLPHGQSKHVVLTGPMSLTLLVATVVVRSWLGKSLRRWLVLPFSQLEFPAETFLCCSVLTATHVRAVSTPEKKKPAPLLWVVLALPRLSPCLKWRRRESETCTLCWDKHIAKWSANQVLLRGKKLESRQNFTQVKFTGFRLKVTVTII